MLTLSKGFASIEQYDSDGIQNFSPCPDIYSLGATMYNLLTGVIPTESILRATKPMAKPSELNKAITPQTEAVIMQAMQISPAKRYKSVKQMLNELSIPTYFEEAENTLSEQSELATEKNDHTMMHSNSSHQEHDDDQTNDKDVLEKARAKRKRRRRVLIPLFIFFAAIFGWTITYILDLNRPEENIPSQMVNVDSVHIVKNERDTKSIETVIPTVPGRNTENDKREGLQTTSNTADGKTRKDANEKETAHRDDGGKGNGSTLAGAEIDAKYASLIASGKTKMGQKKYTEAKADFADAKNLQVTEEVLRLSIACEEEEEQQQIAERMALYEIKYRFGNFTIVRKKSNGRDERDGRYGAIDSKGIERIKAIYLNVAPSANGRAFEREDHTWDIYDENGTRIGNGLTTY
jgi:serine/threonine-protein kinase